jgi:lysine-specific demethylase 8
VTAPSASGSNEPQLAGAFCRDVVSPHQFDPEGNAAKYLGTTHPATIHPFLIRLGYLAEMTLTITTDVQALVPFELQKPKRIAHVDRQTFDSTIRPANEPFVIEGAMTDWPSIETWVNPDRLSELIGDDATVFCRRVVEDVEKYQEDFIPYRFGDFLNEVYEIGESDHYLTQALVFEPIGFLRKVIRSSFPGLLQVLAQDCALPPFVERDEIAEGILWMGSGEQVTPLHYDPAENLNCTIMGSKRWILFPPDEGPNLLVGGHDGSDSMLSSLDELTEGGVWRGGDVRQAYEVTMAPGEILYLPAGYSHHVFSSREPSAAVNFWFVENKLATFKMYTYWQSLDRYGYGHPTRRRAYQASIMAGLLALKAVYRIRPQLIPSPDLVVGEAAYERQGAT